MFEIGELIVYGGTGVCKIADITAPGLNPADKGQLYYKLEPLYSQGIIYAPVNNSKVFSRRVISKDEAQRMIDDVIPSIHAQAFHSSSVQMLNEHYAQFFSSHDCEGLIELIMSIYAKKQNAEAQRRKFGQVDERYMKRAEDLLYGEFAVALGIERSEVPDYIASCLGEDKPDGALS